LDFDFDSANSFKQQSVMIYIARLEHIILIRANQSLLLLLNVWCLDEKQQAPIS